MIEPIFQKARDNNIPIAVLIELTYRCNLDCQHCYVIHDQAQNELSTKEYYELFDSLAKLQTLFLTISGGEPFIRKDLKELIIYATKKNFSIRLFTSGTLLNNDWGNFLREMNILEIETSIYGADPTTHDRMTRISGSFDNLMKGLEILSKNKIKTNVKFIVTKNNYTQAKEIKQFVEELGFNFYYDVILTPKDNLDTTPQQLSLSEKEMREFYRLIDYKVNPIDREKEEYICNAGVATMAISPDGEVYPCVQLRKSAGNIRAESLKNIWDKGKIFQRLRESRIKDYKCGSCPLLNYCSPCIGLIDMETGDINGCSETNKLRATIIKERYE